MESSSNNVITMTNEDNFPFVILRGESANLSALRSVDTQGSFLSQREQPILVSTPIACRLSIPSEEEDGTTVSSSDEEKVSTVEGQLFVTGCQILFVATGGDSNDDWAIGATCIVMHAMTEEPELAIYLQLQEEGVGGDSETVEVTIIPMNPDTCQNIFDSLCKLVSLHPIQDDDDDDDEGHGGGQYFGQDDLIWAPEPSARLAFGEEDEDEEGGGGGATEQERQAMLDHLDNLLVVHPDLEIQEGQFDDAEEDTNL